MIDHAIYAVIESTRLPSQHQIVRNPYDLPYVLPTPEPLSPGESRMATELRAWTGWSDRLLAEVVGTTHPTIRALRSGHIVLSMRNHNYHQRLPAVHAFMSRIYQLAGRSPQRVNALLTDTSLDQAPIERLKAGDVTAAYRTVLDLTARKHQDLIRTWRPLPAAGRVIAPFDVE